MKQYPLSMDVIKRHPEMEFNNLNLPTQGITYRHYGFLLVCTVLRIISKQPQRWKINGAGASRLFFWIRHANCVVYCTEYCIRIHIWSLPPKIFAIPFATWLSQDSTDQKYSKAHYGGNLPACIIIHWFLWWVSGHRLACVSLTYIPQVLAMRDEMHPWLLSHGAACDTWDNILLLPSEVPSHSRHIH